MGDLVLSPFTGTGRKGRLLTDVLACFPERIGTFVDLWCGNCNVVLNVTAGRHIYNDPDSRLIGLYQCMLRMGYGQFVSAVCEVIRGYGLSDTMACGYAFYDCDSKQCLGAYNQAGYQRLRRDVNGMDPLSDGYFVGLYTLSVYAFNHQMRFNQNGQFNMPVGKRDFNARIRKRLALFLMRMQEQDVVFTCQDFQEFDTRILRSSDLVYLDLFDTVWDTDRLQICFFFNYVVKTIYDFAAIMI